MPVNSLTVTASSDLDILSPESPVTPPLEYHSFEVGDTDLSLEEMSANSLTASPPQESHPEDVHTEVDNERNVIPSELDHDDEHEHEVSSMKSGDYLSLDSDNLLIAISQTN